MRIKISLKQRTSDVFAEAVYEDGTITVLPGGIISSDFAGHIRGGKKAKSYRENKEFVDQDRRILKNCVFTSPSTAAQFVTGRSTNGYEAWKVEGKESLGDYLREKGMR